MLIHNLNKKELKPDETRGYKLIKDLNPPQNFLNPRKIDELCKNWLEKAGLGPSYRIWVVVNYYERPKPLYFDFMNSPYIEFFGEDQKAYSDRAAFKSAESGFREILFPCLRQPRAN